MLEAGLKGEVASNQLIEYSSLLQPIYIST
jgi:hypothetical protein